MSPDQQIASVAASQHSLVTRDQARKAGLTDDQVGYRLATGRWRRVRPRVFALAGCVPTREQALLAACLSAGDVVFVSHLTAATVWGLPVRPSATIDLLTLPHRRVRLQSVAQHRTSLLPIDDVTTADGLPITSPARTLVDVAGILDADPLRRAVHAGLRRGLVHLEALRSCHQRLDVGAGRPLLAMRALLDGHPRGFQPGGSDWELRVLRWFRRGGLPVPVQEHAVQVGGRSFRLDLAFPDVRVAVEFDGWEDHGTFTAFHADRERARLLASAGWRIVPVTARTSEHALLRDVAAILRLCGQS